MAQVYAEIALSNVGMVYKTEGSDVTALTGVTFDIQKGEFISLLGPLGLRQDNPFENHCRAAGEHGRHRDCRRYDPHPGP